MVSVRRNSAPTNEWVLNKAVVKRELLDTVKARKPAYYGHTMRKQGSCVEKEIMQGTMPGARRRGRPRTAWTDNIKTWTGLSVEESVRMTEDGDKWRKYVHGVAKLRIARTAKEQNRTALLRRCWSVTPLLTRHVSTLAGPVRLNTAVHSLHARWFCD